MGRREEVIVEPGAKLAQMYIRHGLNGAHHLCLIRRTVGLKRPVKLRVISDAMSVR